MADLFNAWPTDPILAHRLQFMAFGRGISLIVLANLGLGACVIPPPLNTEASNTPPVIDRASSRPSFKDEYKIIKTAAGATPADANVRLLIIDPDRDDQVATRVFIDRDHRTIFDDYFNGWSKNRWAFFNFGGLCDDFSLDSEHTLEFVISDTGFVDTGNDLRVAATVAGRTGSRDFELLKIKCIAAP